MMKLSKKKLIGTTTAVSLLILGVSFFSHNQFEASKPNYEPVDLLRGYVESQESKNLESYHMEVPLYNQMSGVSLPYGCEVTALGMLLSYYGYDGDKNRLQAEIVKVPYEDDQGYKGNPDEGFVGDATGKQPGTGVNHGPIAQLAQKRVGANYLVKDITGQGFAEVKQQVLSGHPVWVVTSIDDKLPTQEDTIEWKTAKGTVDLQLKHHAAVLTGVDQEFVYLNDAYGIKKKIPLTQFEAIYHAMGSQAIYLEKNGIS